LKGRIRVTLEDSTETKGKPGKDMSEYPLLLALLSLVTVLFGMAFLAVITGKVKV